MQDCVHTSFRNDAADNVILPLVQYKSFEWKTWPRKIRMWLISTVPEDQYNVAREKRKFKLALGKKGRMARFAGDQLSK